MHSASRTVKGGPTGIHFTTPTATTLLLPT
jgi:hypothetical protein